MNMVTKYNNQSEGFTMKKEMKNTDTQPTKAVEQSELQNITMPDEETMKNELMQVEDYQIDNYKNEIITLDNQSIMNYGREQQQQLSEFSDRMLKDVQNDNIKGIGRMLESLTKELDDSNPEKLLPENQGFVTRMFNRTKKEIKKQFQHLTSVSQKVDKVSKELENQQQILVKDINSLDTLYNHNQDYFKEVNALVEAGYARKDELQKNELIQLREKANSTGTQEDIQAVADMEDFIDRLDKRIYDLQLSRDIALQSAPQIRMIQNINQSLAEKIQSSLMTSIPLWKNQMAIALSLSNQRQIADAQKRVTDTTNDLLVKNSEMLKTNAIKTATENDRSVIDIDTLKQTQANVRETIQKTLEIKEEGQRKREEAKKELAQLESHLMQQQLNDQKQQSQIESKGDV